MKIVFHGTSLQNANNIVKDGYKPRFSNWTVSTGNPFFWDFPIKREAFQRALYQGLGASIRHDDMCKRAVLAVEVNEDDIIPDSTGTTDKYAVEYIKTTFGVEQIVGFWCDVYDLTPIKYFSIFKHQHLKLYNKVEIPDNINALKQFFTHQIPEAVSVPIQTIFCKTELDFDTTTELFYV